MRVVPVHANATGCQQGDIQKSGILWRCVSRAWRWPSLPHSRSSWRSVPRPRALAVTAGRVRLRRTPTATTTTTETGRTRTVRRGRNTATASGTRARPHRCRAPRPLRRRRHAPSRTGTRRMTRRSSTRRRRPGRHPSPSDLRASTTRPRLSRPRDGWRRLPCLHDLRSTRPARPPTAFGCCAGLTKNPRVSTSRLAACRASSWSAPPPPRRSTGPTWRTGCGFPSTSTSCAAARARFVVGRACTRVRTSTMTGCCASTRSGSTSPTHPEPSSRSSWSGSASWCAPTRSSPRTSAAGAASATRHARR